MTTIIALLISSFAHASFFADASDLVLVQGNKTVYCKSADDLGTLALRFEDLRFDTSTSEQVVSVKPVTIKCIQPGNGYEWAPVHGKESYVFKSEEYQGRKYTTTIQYRELVALIDENEYVVGNKYSTSDKNVAIDVRLFDRLKKDLKDVRTLDLAVRSTLVTYDDLGVLQDRYYAFSGWYRLQIKK